MTNIQAAIGLAQVEKIETSLAHKRWMGEAYTERLQNIEQLQLPVEKPWAKNVYWMYGIILDESTGMDAVEFANRLRSKGVDTRPFFLECTSNLYFKNEGDFNSEVSRHRENFPSRLVFTIRVNYYWSPN